MNVASLPPSLPPTGSTGVQDCVHSLLPRGPAEVSGQEDL